MSNTISCVIPQPDVLEIPNSIQGDRRLITEMAPVIRNLWAQIDNVAVYLKAGREFEILHNRLSKNSRHDRKRIGWYRAFQEERFGCSRQEAEACIKIYEAFGDVANTFATSKLPQSLGALHMLARLELSPAALAQRLLSGEINPKTSVRAIRKLGESLGRIEPQHAAKNSETADAAIVKELKRLWGCASPKGLNELLNWVGPDGLRAAMSPELCDAHRKRYADQFARANPRAAASPKVVPRTEVLALPPPDLVADWDLAAAEERRKFAKERGHEFIEAV